MAKSPIAAKKNLVCPKISFPVLRDDRLNPDFFKAFDQLYSKTFPFSLIFVDPEGNLTMGLPQCEQFPCLKSCRDCRERLIQAAFRRGSIAMDTCHEGFVLWGTSILYENQMLGGLIVLGAGKSKGYKLNEFASACTGLHQLLLECGLEVAPSGVQDRASDVQYLFYHDVEAIRKDLDALTTKLVLQFREGEIEASEETAKEWINRLEDAWFLDPPKRSGLIGLSISRLIQGLEDCGHSAYELVVHCGEILHGVHEATNPQDFRKIMEEAVSVMTEKCARPPDDPASVQLQKAVTYIEEHLRDDLSRNQVAKASGLSPSYLSHLIKEKKGRTFSDLLNQYRIEHACKKLIHSNESVAAIATEVGFCDQSYFSKVFHRYKGESPNQFRQAKNKRTSS